MRGAWPGAQGAADSGEGKGEGTMRKQQWWVIHAKGATRTPLQYEVPPCISSTHGQYMRLGPPSPTARAAVGDLSSQVLGFAKQGRAKAACIGTGMLLQHLMGAFINHQPSWLPTASGRRLSCPPVCPASLSQHNNAGAIPPTPRADLVKPPPLSPLSPSLLRWRAERSAHSPTPLAPLPSPSPAVGRGADWSTADRAPLAGGGAR